MQGALPMLFSPEEHLDFLVSECRAVNADDPGPGTGPMLAIAEAAEKLGNCGCHLSGIVLFILGMECATPEGLERLAILAGATETGICMYGGFTVEQARRSRNN